MALGLTDRGFSSTTAGTSATTTATSASFSPTGARRVLALCHVTLNGTAPTFALSDTFTGTGSWAEISAGTYDYGNGYKVRVAVWSAVLGATPGTGTVTVTRSPSGSVDQWLSMYVVEVTGNPCTIGNSGGNGTAGTSTSVTFAPSAPASTSLCVGHSTTDWNSNVLTPPSGWTEQAENSVSWFGDHAWSSIASSAASSVSFGGGNTNVVAAAVELIEDTGGAASDPVPPLWSYRSSILRR